MPRSKLDEILSQGNSKFDPEKDLGFSAYKHHNRICSQLHPNEPSCLKNFTKALFNESLRVSKWMGTFFAILVSISNRKSLMKGYVCRGGLYSVTKRLIGLGPPFEFGTTQIRNIRMALYSWIESTIRGTLFVSGRCGMRFSLTGVHSYKSFN